ncbi:MAG: 4-alpha-glucanotransferase [Ruminococcaceae bacterium]|nr:4-alpha-glucanotransferase [Oscillospiraceae bacterium]
MERKSGVLMHVSSLWGDYSEGSLGRAAREWIDFLAEGGFKVWQVLPFCLPDEWNSPYKSNGAFSLNPNFIDLPTLREMGLLTNGELESARQLTPYSCEFKRLREERFALLRRAAGRVKDWAPIERFLNNHPQVDAFCRFMALKEANGGAEWVDWTVDTPNEETLRAWQFTQYEFFCEWAELKAYANAKGVQIIGDIPIYVAYDSSDVWANRELFLLDERDRPTAVAGVPPDYFAKDGQLWGNPLYNWSKMKEDGYAWWRERMAFMLELFDGVRIDHFRGLESYFSIPAGETTARNGRWVQGPGMDLIRAIQPLCEGKLIIAEDLGVITPEVRELVRESGFPGMRVLQFGFIDEEDNPHLPHNYDNHCVAYTGTHDNNTLLGYVWEMSDYDRRRLLEYCDYDGADWDNCYPAVLRTMFQSHAGLLIIPIQDLLLYGSDTRINTPGNSEGNWSYRITRAQLYEIDRKRFLNWNRIYRR